MVKILNGDVIKMLNTIPDGYFHTCVTSPPYFGLRDYGVDGQIGLEQTPDEFVRKLVEVFREVRRTLRDDGTLWLNLGDTYATGTKAERQQSPNAGVGANSPEAQNSVRRIGTPTGLKTKDLIGIPWRVAFALQADGWYLRQDIIWHKPNPMPESVTDRCTKAHEYIFLLSKSPKYYFDNDSIRVPHKRLWNEKNGGNLADVGHKKNGKIETKDTHPKGYPMPNPLGANRRSVWTVNTKPYRGAHFATFPTDLIEPCILAGAPIGGNVLDPFGGSGTTGLVSSNHGRNAVMIEINPEYVELAKDRLGIFYSGASLDETP